MREELEQRLWREFIGLGARIDKVRKLIKYPKKETDTDILVRQLKPMEEYHKILHERIYEKTNK